MALRHRASKARLLIASTSLVSLTPFSRARPRWKRGWSALPPATRAAMVVGLGSPAAGPTRFQRTEALRDPNLIRR
jgi:AraC-like DNA-binding protein